jgi:hypothetical protein
MTVTKRALFGRGGVILDNNKNNYNKSSKTSKAY